MEIVGFGAEISMFFFLMKEVRKGSSGAVAFIELTRVESLEINNVGVDYVVGNRPTGEYMMIQQLSATTRGFNLCIRFIVYYYYLIITFFFIFLYQ